MRKWHEGVVYLVGFTLVALPARGGSSIGIGMLPRLCTGVLSTLKERTNGEPTQVPVAVRNGRKGVSITFSPASANADRSNVSDFTPSCNFSYQAADPMSVMSVGTRGFCFPREVPPNQAPPAPQTEFRTSLTAKADRGLVVDFVEPNSGSASRWTLDFNAEATSLAMELRTAPGLEALGGTLSCWPVPEID